MKNIHQPIKDIMSYYALKIENRNVLAILKKESIDSEQEAKEILTFLNSMCDKISEDAKENINVLHQPIHTTDAEKICDIIEDYVEIGCNVCIDRATFGMTRIGKGTKIDNLVQIAHNNDIGEHCIIVSHVGLSGSVTLGKRVTLAGQVGIADHITMGDGSTAAARTGISKDVQPNQVVWGAPNRPIKQVMREMASITRLPALLGQVKKLTQRLTALEDRLSALDK